ncbi:hypothetical protein BJ742DRAFT_910068 [Cladochytrium replicatum]|nr:hypothetical protein BJ742DRAFT_910068 [Cladochytrium replicatum]
MKNPPFLTQLLGRKCTTCARKSLVIRSTTQQRFNSTAVAKEALGLGRRVIGRLECDSNSEGRRGRELAKTIEVLIGTGRAFGLSPGTAGLLMRAYALRNELDKVDLIASSLPNTQTLLSHLTIAHYHRALRASSEDLHDAFQKCLDTFVTLCSLHTSADDSTDPTLLAEATAAAHTCAMLLGTNNHNNISELASKLDHKRGNQWVDSFVGLAPPAPIQHHIVRLAHAGLLVLPDTHAPILLKLMHAALKTLIRDPATLVALPKGLDVGDLLRAQHCASVKVSQAIMDGVEISEEIELFSAQACLDTFEGVRVKVSLYAPRLEDYHQLMYVLNVHGQVQKKYDSGDKKMDVNAKVVELYATLRAQDLAPTTDTYSHVFQSFMHRPFVRVQSKHAIATMIDKIEAEMVRLEVPHDLSSLTAIMHAYALTPRAGLLGLQRAIEKLAEAREHKGFKMDLAGLYAVVFAGCAAHGSRAGESIFAQYVGEDLVHSFARDCGGGGDGTIGVEGVLDLWAVGAARRGDVCGAVRAVRAGAGRVGRGAVEMLAMGKEAEWRRRVGLLLEGKHV